jgi:mono/diheme cytochrome c family protein
MAIVRAVSLIVGVLGVSLALAACGGESSGTTTMATQTPSGPSPAEEAAEREAAEKERAREQQGAEKGAAEQTGAEKTTPEKATAEKAAPERTSTEKTTAKAGGKPNAATEQGNAATEQGKEVFMANGCGACHTLAAAGTASTVGPDLDEALPGKSAAFIHESIVDPNATVAPGYTAGIMPPTFGSTLSSSELEALVAFLQQSAGK